MKEMLVIGVGSRVMMDDGIGIYLAEDLEKHIISSGVEFAIGETDIDYCLSEISETKFIVIIDAFLSGMNPGEVTIIPLYDVKRQNNSVCFSHGIHLFDIILGSGYEIKGILIGIEPYEINYNFGLSGTMRGMYPNIYQSVYEHLNRIIEGSH